ncbi:MAG: LURP-one-related/scramblase family protein [Anaerolineae bacterium]
MRAAAAAAAPEERIGTRFQMRQRFFTIGDRFFIENDQGQRAFRVENNILRVRTTLRFQDMQGNDIYKIQEKLARIRDTMNIEDANGNVVATVHNALITPLRDRWKINVRGSDNLMTRGNILNHEYKIERDGAPVAVVSKRWFRLRDTYGVEVASSEDSLLMLAITVVVDMMAHSGR